MSRHGSFERGDAVESARARHARAVDPTDLGPLFGADDAPRTTTPVSPAATHDDYATSRAAADAVVPGAGRLRDRVLELIKAAGRNGMTDLELESLAEFSAFGASTVRKRRSENKAAGLVFPGGRRDGATVWVAF